MEQYNFAKCAAPFLVRLLVHLAEKKGAYRHYRGEAGTLPLDAIGRAASSTGMRRAGRGGMDLCGGGWDRGNGDVQRNGEGGVEAIKR